MQYKSTLNQSPKLTVFPLLSLELPRQIWIYSKPCSQPATGDGSESLLRKGNVEITKKSLLERPPHWLQGLFSLPGKSDFNSGGVQFTRMDGLKIARVISWFAFRNTEMTIRTKLARKPRRDVTSYNLIAPNLLLRWDSRFASFSIAWWARTMRRPGLHGNAFVFISVCSPLQAASRRTEILKCDFTLPVTNTKFENHCSKAVFWYTFRYVTLYFVIFAPFHGKGQVNHDRRIDMTKSSPVPNRCLGPRPTARFKATDRDETVGQVQNLRQDRVVRTDATIQSWSGTVYHRSCKAINRLCMLLAISRLQ